MRSAKIIDALIPLYQDYTANVNECSGIIKNAVMEFDDEDYGDEAFVLLKLLKKGKFDKMKSDKVFNCIFEEFCAYIKNEKRISEFMTEEY